MATKTKAQQEIERLTGIIERESERAQQDRHYHDVVVMSLKSQLATLREERRRLTQVVESLAGRCDIAEAQPPVMSPVTPTSGNGCGVR